MKTRLTIAILALGIALTGCNLVEVEACNKRGGDAGPSCQTIFVPIQKQSR